MPAVNESNSMVKEDKGVMPDPLMSALNAAMTQYLGGTSYNGGPTSMGPPRTLPGGMQMQVAPQPPLPTPNPMFHPQSPLEYDMGALFAQAMQGMQAPPELPMAAMGNENDLPLPETPPVPEKRPDRNKKPERTKRVGNESTEPKQKYAPPKKKRMVAEK
jgi:hypothetical protein